MESPVQLARQFADAAHNGQKYGEDPYVRHLDDVATLLEPFGDAARILGYLHDIYEDTDTTFDAVAKDFGEGMAYLVAAVTDVSGKNRRERKRATNGKLSRLPSNLTMALVVKAADRLANLRECRRTGDSRLEMYRREHDDFFQAAYRPGLCDSFWEEMAKLLTD